MIFLAHGISGREDLPVSLTVFLYAAAAVMVVSFLALSIGWSKPKWNSYKWSPAPGWLQSIAISPILLWSARIVVLALFALTVLAATFGSEYAVQNLAPTMVWVIWVVGIVPLSVVLGPVIRAINPWHTLARLLRVPRAGGMLSRVGIWPATIFVLLLAWFELCNPWASTPRGIAIIALTYTAFTIAAMARYGYNEWLDRGEVFSVYTSLLARMSPLEVRANVDGTRTLGFRMPATGTTTLHPSPGQVLFITALVGGVAFDGLSRSSQWRDNWVFDLTRFFTDTIGVAQDTAGTAAATIGLAITIGFAYGAYELASWAASKLGSIGERLTVGRTADAFVHSLIPIAIAYTVAHYFSFFVFQGQDVFKHISDPFGNGSDWFGTADFKVDLRYPTANTIWIVQIISIVVGHVIALFLAHDRALQIAHGARKAVRSQYAMLALMVIYTVGGLWSLHASYRQ